MVITNLWGHINFKRLSSDNKKSKDFRNQDKHWIFQSTKFPWVPIHEVIIQIQCHGKNSQAPVL